MQLELCIVEYVLYLEIQICFSPIQKEGQIPKCDVMIVEFNIPWVSYACVSMYDHIPCSIKRFKFEYEIEVEYKNKLNGST